MSRQLIGATPKGYPIALELGRKIRLRFTVDEISSQLTETINRIQLQPA